MLGVLYLRLAPCKGPMALPEPMQGLLAEIVLSCAQQFLGVAQFAFIAKDVSAICGFENISAATGKDVFGLWPLK